MSCPHSNAPGSSPETCSLCVQAVPRRVTIVDGRFLIDGTPVHETREAQHEETQRSMPGRMRTCGRCGKKGHYRSTCNVEVSS